MLLIICYAIMHINMLYHDRIDVAEGIDIHKASVSKESYIFHYWNFFR